MTPEEALQAMDVIEAQCDGTPESIAQAARLVRELIEGNPEDFWQRFFEEKSREQTLRFLGAIGIEVPNSQQGGDGE